MVIFMINALELDVKRWYYFCIHATSWLPSIKTYWKCVINQWDLSNDHVINDDMPQNIQLYKRSKFQLMILYVVFCNNYLLFSSKSIIFDSYLVVIPKMYLVLILLNAARQREARRFSDIIQEGRLEIH